MVLGSDLTLGLHIHPLSTLVSGDMETPLTLMVVSIFPIYTIRTCSTMGSQCTLYVTGSNYFIIDVKVLEQTACMIKPGGIFYVGIPGGPDAVAYNAHRMYHYLHALFGGWVNQ